MAPQLGELLYWAACWIAAIVALKVVAMIWALRCGFAQVSDFGKHVEDGSRSGDRALLESTIAGQVATRRRRARVRAAYETASSEEIEQQKLVQVRSPEAACGRLILIEPDSASVISTSSMFETKPLYTVEVACKRSSVSCTIL